MNMSEKRNKKRKKVGNDLKGGVFVDKIEKRVERSGKNMSLTLVTKN